MGNLALSVEKFWRHNSYDLSYARSKLATACILDNTEACTTFVNHFVSNKAKAFSLNSQLCEKGEVSACVEKGIVLLEQSKKLEAEPLLKMGCEAKINKACEILKNSKAP